MKNRILAMPAAPAAMPPKPRTAAIGGEHDVGHAAAAEREEEDRERREQRGTVLLRSPQDERGDGEQQPESREIEGADGDDQESHRPRLLLAQLDGQELQARAHG